MMASLLKHHCCRQNEPENMQLCGQEPLGPAGFGLRHQFLAAPYPCGITAELPQDFTSLEITSQRLHCVADGAVAVNRSAF